MKKNGASVSKFIFRDHQQIDIVFPEVVGHCCFRSHPLVIFFCKLVELSDVFVE
jgi:hypothetical protein